MSVPLSAPGPIMGDVARPSVAAGALTYWCHNCCTEWADTFCDTCGATLNERAGGQNLVVAAPRSEGEST